VGLLHALPEDDVPGHEFLVDQALLDDHMGHGIGDGQVRVGFEDHRDVGRLVGAPVRIGLEAYDPHVRVLVLSLDHPGVQDGVPLGKVRAPHAIRVGQIEVFIAAHGFVHAEARVEAGHGGGHAEARVALDVVAAHSSLHEFVCRVALENGGLAREIHAHRLWTMILNGFSELGSHEVQGAVP